MEEEPKVEEPDEPPPEASGGVRTSASALTTK